MIKRLTKKQKAAVDKAVKEVTEHLQNNFKGRLKPASIKKLVKATYKATKESLDYATKNSVIKSFKDFKVEQNGVSIKTSFVFTPIFPAEVFEWKVPESIPTNIVLKVLKELEEKHEKNIQS